MQGKLMREIVLITGLLMLSVSAHADYAGIPCGANGDDQQLSSGLLCVWCWARF